ncbi:hypothetical protein DYB38_005874 [Aphanomyces astaci]|uniref:AB hydrolase-1 domain-containing protein n=1 Tax=Aphanomyces astaci TaxID=112090 RepID=A0A397AWL3_APHAT|nr:hypothetical protein DYB36_006778 [Aphanomyces astaci]RHY45488.1 hypothetical protein DYB38_005874 [Aphanomyces astaci]RHZ39799.1 hypothetical protein DYB31_004999 [Aphanomyces astaci]
MTMSGALKTIGKCLLALILAPFAIAGFALFVGVWFVMTITLIGPIIHYCYNKRDLQLLDRSRLCAHVPDLQFIRIPHGNHGAGYDLAVRFTPSTNTSLPPVCIPNGLGASMTTISPLHEELAKRGYAVLSYDRLGVGLSDRNITGVPPSADDVVKDMDFILSAVLPQSTKWLVVGPSMGSIVGQYFVATYPSRVVAFLNMDGFPYPFCRRRTKFILAGYIYKAYASIIWTGVMRPFISMGIQAWRSRLESAAFSIDVVCAETNQTNFFRNLAFEMNTMIDLADKVNAAWGRQSCLELAPADLQILVHTKPSAVGDVRDDGVWVPIDDSDVTDQLIPNYGTIEPAVTAQAVASLLARQPQSELAKTWQTLHVAVMSGRNFDYAGASMFIDDEMKDWYAAEHAMHALLAAHGTRTVFPKKAHSDMFAMVKCIVDHVDKLSGAIDI